MKLWDELLPNASDERIHTVLVKIKEIEEHLTNTTKVNSLIEALNTFSSRAYDKTYFQYIFEHENIEDVARDIAQIPPQKTTLTDAELTELVDRITNNDVHSHFYYELIDMNINYGAAAEIIDFPENQGLKSSEEIAHFIRYCR